MVRKYYRLLASMLLLVMCTGLFSGCGTKQNGEASGYGKNGKLSVVCTIFPEYDWVKQIVGENNENIEITMLLDDGVDLHSYQPTAEDILKIASCDLLIYVGGESDVWMKDALKEKTNKNMKVITLLKILGENAKEEEIVEGMEAEEEEDTEESIEENGEKTNGDKEEKTEAPEYDEHVWLSLRNASLFVENISEELQTMDPEHAQDYALNTKAYVEQLQFLDEEYQKAADEGTKDTLVFADRFPFRYLMDDYGLHYYAAFAGCSAETEASFETIIFLAKKVDELQLENVLVSETSDGKIARTVIENTKRKDQGKMILDSMQSMTGKDVKAGVTYLSTMELNLNVFREAVR